MVVGYIRGVQDRGVSACVKHYAANNQETHRDDIDVEMSERARREIYLPGFRAAVQQGGVYALMGSYNKFRGTYATENAYLTNTILKGERGFKGLVMSDYSVHNTQDAHLQVGDAVKCLTVSSSLRYNAQAKSLSRRERRGAFSELPAPRTFGVVRVSPGKPASFTIDAARAGILLYWDCVVLI